MFRKLTSFAKRYLKYAAIRMMMMGAQYLLASLFELTELVDFDKFSIWPSLTETLAIYSNQRSIPIVLARGVLNLSPHMEYITLVETLYVLYELFDWQNDEYSLRNALLCCCYTLIKFAIKMFLTWIMNESEWPILNHPNSIHVAISFEQTDSIEFSTSCLDMAFDIVVDVILDILNFDQVILIFKL